MSDTYLVTAHPEGPVVATEAGMTRRTLEHLEIGVRASAAIEGENRAGIGRRRYEAIAARAAEALAGGIGS